MSESWTVQGRRLSAGDVQGIGQLIATHPQWSRWRLSRHLCQQWDWRNGAGQLKDMAARALLLKLERRGLIALPAKRRAALNRMRRPKAPVRFDQRVMAGSLAELGPLSLAEVSADRLGRKELAAALNQFHYLGHGGTVGENLQYVLREGGGRPLAFILFGAAAWKCQPRDAFIGWTPAQREQQLSLIANNTRFLIPAWVQVAHLGSWLLSQVLRRLSGDWQAKYGHRIVLVETFVQQPRFAGTVYRAANWRWVGATTGRTRQDRDRSIQSPRKDVYVYALRQDFREVLCR